MNTQTNDSNLEWTLKLWNFIENPQSYKRAWSVASNPPSVFFKTTASQSNLKNPLVGVNHYAGNFNDVCHLIWKRIGVGSTNQSVASFEMNLREDRQNFFSLWNKRDKAKTVQDENSTNGAILHKKEFSSIPSWKFFLKGQYSEFLPPMTETGKWMMNKLPFVKAEKEEFIK